MKNRSAPPYLTCSTRCMSLATCRNTEFLTMLICLHLGLPTLLPQCQAAGPLASRTALLRACRVTPACFSVYFFAWLSGSELCYFRARLTDCLSACLPACLPAYQPANLLANPPACVDVYLPSKPWSCIFALPPIARSNGHLVYRIASCLPTYVHASLFARMSGCSPACLPSYLPARDRLAHPHHSPIVHREPLIGVAA